MSACPWCDYTAGHEPNCLGGQTIQAPRMTLDRVRPTSREAWRDLDGSPELGAMQAAALAYCKTHGPCTGREADHALKGDGYHKRFSELAALGLVREVEIRPCRVSGKRAVAWGVV
jgi:hypothetical protein